MRHDVAVFFDIGDTLASPVIENGQLAGLDVYPFVTHVLTLLREFGDDRGSVSLGLISNTGNATLGMMDDLLDACGLRSLVDPRLCLYSSVEGLDKSQPALFERARSRAGLPAASCVYVGEDTAERAVAASVGFRISPQPLHALHLIESEFAPPTPLSTHRTT
jgi:FMN phosphatase YigB (HAD superfamily)